MTAESIVIIISLGLPIVIIITILLLDYEKHIPENLQDELLYNFLMPVTTTIINKRVNFSTLTNLPPPVERYLKNVLTDGQPLIDIVKTKQRGELRTNTFSKKWYAFTARQLITPITTGFIWSAKVETPLKTWLRVSDSYISGIGGGKVDFLSIIPLVSQSNVAQLNSGALYRYLAEAVWYPTALLPESGVEWTAINNYAALATITHGSLTVSLKFIFNDDSEVTGIYTASRYQKLHGKYYSTAWEGHFKNYINQSGVSVPSYGEVGWYRDGEWECVWRAHLVAIKFKFHMSKKLSNCQSN